MSVQTLTKKYSPRSKLTFDDNLCALTKHMESARVMRAIEKKYEQLVEENKQTHWTETAKRRLQRPRTGVNLQNLF